MTMAVVWSPLSVGYDSRGQVSVTHLVDEWGYGRMLTQPEPDGAGPGEDRTSP